MRTSGSINLNVLSAEIDVSLPIVITSGTPGRAALSLSLLGGAPLKASSDPPDQVPKHPRMGLPAAGYSRPTSPPLTRTGGQHGEGPQSHQRVSPTPGQLPPVSQARACHTSAAEKTGALGMRRSAGVTAEVTCPFREAQSLQRALPVPGLPVPHGQLQATGEKPGTRRRVLLTGPRPW